MTTDALWKLCGVEACQNAAESRGWCPKHYWRWKKYGDPDTPVRVYSTAAPALGTRQCTVSGCERPRRTKEWCGTHYARWRKEGDVAGERRIRERYDSNICRSPVCDRPRRTKGLCLAHYQRFKKHGEAALVTPITVAVPPAVRGCHVEGCTRPHQAQGYCGGHYLRFRATGDPGGAELQAKMKQTGWCHAPGCTDPSRAKNMCAAHYRRLALGQPLSEKKKYAPAGAGYVNGGGYRVIRVNGRSVMEHRHFVQELLGRTLLATETVHHVNGVKTDNRTDGPLVEDEQGRWRSGNLELWSHAHPYGQEIGPKSDWARGWLAAYGTGQERVAYAGFADPLPQAETGGSSNLGCGEEKQSAGGNSRVSGTALGNRGRAIS
ncbi:hypothetical protein ACF058_27725 [Streptomyces sp. NPDC015501]|uniref:hypothetical protein n=1 Tax=unclassified Streptomyces TaxID=2593676 RepID=UPI0011A1E2D2|nr:hypothetical protein A3L22_30180 [Streptomyces griseus subsp. griseus]